MSKMSVGAERLAKALEVGQQAAARVTSGKPVQIRFDLKEGAYVDSETGIIHLPPLGDISDTAVDIIRGLADHEAGHMGFTDLEIFKDQIDKSKEDVKDGKPANFGGINHTFFNSIEDNRVDKKSSEKSLGVARNIDWLSRHHLYDRDLLSKIEENFAEDKRAQALALISMEANFKGTEHEEFVKEEASRISELYTLMRKEVEEELEKIPSLEDTEETLELSDKIVEKLKKYIEKEKQARKKVIKKKKGKGSGKKGESVEGVGGEEEREGEGEEERDIEKEFEKGMAGIGTGSTIFAGATFEELEGEVEESRLDRTDKYKEPFIPYIDGDRIVDLYKCSDLIKEYTGFHEDSEIQLLEYGFNRWNEHIREQRQGINVMRRKLLIDLLGRVKKFVNNQDDGQISDRELWRTAIGDKNVFRKRQKQTEINSAVTLLIDCSGSMIGHKIKVASATAMIMAETLSLVGVPFEVLGFNQITGSLSSSDAERIRELGYTRIYPLNNYIFKSFKQTLDRRCKSLIGAIPNIELCENIDGESLRWSARRLALRKEQKRILIVISDGYPAGYSEYDVHEDLTTVCNTIEQSGEVSLFGIGICSDAPERYYSNYAIIDDPSELPKTAYGKISKFLRGKRKIKVH